jgi:uncharacterized protein (DUF697 family)
MTLELASAIAGAVAFPWLAALTWALGRLADEVQQLRADLTAAEVEAAQRLRRA